jgi:hypothetical protein
MIKQIGIIALLAGGAASLGKVAYDVHQASQIMARHPEVREIFSLENSLGETVDNHTIIRETRERIQSRIKELRAVPEIESADKERKNYLSGIVPYVFGGIIALAIGTGILKESGFRTNYVSQ